MLKCARLDRISCEQLLSFVKALQRLWFELHTDIGFRAQGPIGPQKKEKFEAHISHLP
jgi:hypothetical protein